MIKIVYKDIAVGAKAAFTPTASGQDEISHIADLNADTLEFENYSTICELNQTLLDGSQSILPDDTADIPLGIWSKQLSGDNGSFNTPVTLIMTASGLFSSQGITLTFDTDNNIYAAEINIKWYKNSALLHSADFTPNSAIYFCNKKVDNYNKVVIAFKKLNFPHCRLKLRALDHGVIRVFAGKPLTDISIIQECSPVSDELSIDTMDFTLIGDEDVDYVFKSKQPLSLYNNADLLGVFFVNSFDRTAERIYNVRSDDYIGLLDEVQFAGGMYDNMNAVSLLTAIFNAAGVPVTIDEGLQSRTIFGWIPICSCREAVRQICFAIGAAVSTVRSDKVRIFIPSDVVVRKFGLEDTIQGQTFADRDKKLTELRLMKHNYTKLSEAVEAYKAENSGTGVGIYVGFSEPLHDLSIVNGSITESGANYAVITANANCVLTGKRYRDLTSVISRTNPLTNVGDPANVVEIKDMTLVSAENAARLLNSLWEYYSQCGTVTSELVLNGERPGDLVVLSTEYLGEITARIESERYNLYGGAIVAEVAAR